MVRLDGPASRIAQAGKRMHMRASLSVRVSLSAAMPIVPSTDTYGTLTASPATGAQHRNNAKRWPG